MTKWLFAVTAALLGFAATASAQQPGCQNCNQGAPAVGGHWGGHAWSNTAHQWTAHPWAGHPMFNRGGQLSRMPTLPVYMAAPWYLYWPYDGHFQTVAPMAAQAQFYPPPQMGYGGNPMLPVYPGYAPNLANPNYPYAPAPAAQPAPKVILPNVPAPKSLPPIDEKK